MVYKHPGKGGAVRFIVPLSQPNSLLLPKHKVCSLCGRAPWPSPICFSPRPDIVALLQPRLANTKTRFSSMSRIVFVLVLAGIWGRVTDNRHNINIHPAQTGPAIIIPWWPTASLSCFILFYSAAEYSYVEFLRDHVMLTNCMFCAIKQSDQEKVLEVQPKEPCSMFSCAWTWLNKRLRPDTHEWVLVCYFIIYWKLWSVWTWWKLTLCCCLDHPITPANTVRTKVMLIHTESHRKSLNSQHCAALHKR